MLIGHTLKYLPAQLLSPAAQLISVILWTHWLAPSEMGMFTLVTVTQEIAYTLCLGWFSVYALRYLPPDSEKTALQRYLRTENIVVIASVLAALLTATVTALTLENSRPLWLSALMIGLYFATRALNTHYGERARAQSSFLAYTLLQVGGPVGGLGLGLLAFRFFDASALLLLAAYALAQAVSSLLAFPMLGMTWRLSKPDSQLLKAAIGFGAPMLGLGALGWVAENYIRYLVQWESGAATLGLMIVGWSLGRRCASVASMLVATAAFPLAARLLNEGRRDEALAQLSINAAMLLAVLLPAAVALQFLGPALMALAVAPEYRETTIELLGLSVLAGTMRNLHIHVTDQLIVLERHLKTAAMIDVLEIGACVIASLIGLRLYGLYGAISGQAIGSTLTLAVSMYWTSSRLGFSWPWLATVKVLLASVLMAAVLGWLDNERNISGLVIGTLAGSLSYVLAMAVLFSPELLRLRAART
jgi:O-antigen/teichoic acid export membrane protein